VRPTEHFELEINFVYEAWGASGDITVSDVDMTIDSALGATRITDDIRLPTHFHDAWSVRLGGEGDIGKHVIARAGLIYETGAVPAEQQGANLIDGNKVGYGLGGTYKAHDRFDLDFGLFQSFIPSRTVDNSEVGQIVADPLSGEIAEGRVVGDARVDSHITHAGGGVSWYFDGNNSGRVSR